jgi:hypothetical protein
VVTAAESTRALNVVSTARAASDAAKDRAESPSDWPVEGLLVHAAGENGPNVRFVDVWESQEAAQRFGEKPAPHLKRRGSQQSRRSIKRTRS